MSLVPSHDCFLLKKAAGNTCLPVDSYNSGNPFQSAHPPTQKATAVILWRNGISQTDPASVESIRRHNDFSYSTVTQFICSRGATDQTIHPRAQSGGIYDVLQENAVGNCSVGVCNRRRDSPVAGSHLASNYLGQPAIGQGSRLHPCRHRSRSRPVYHACR